MTECSKGLSAAACADVGHDRDVRNDRGALPPKIRSRHRVNDCARSPAAAEGSNSRLSMPQEAFVPHGATGEVAIRAQANMADTLKCCTGAAEIDAQGCCDSGDGGYLDGTATYFEGSRQGHDPLGRPKISIRPSRNAITVHPGVDEVAVIVTCDGLPSGARRSRIVLVPRRGRRANLQTKSSVGETRAIEKFKLRKPSNWSAPWPRNHPAKCCGEKCAIATRQGARRLRPLNDVTRPLAGRKIAAVNGRRRWRGDHAAASSPRAQAWSSPISRCGGGDELGHKSSERARFKLRRRDA